MKTTRMGMLVFATAVAEVLGATPLVDRAVQADGKPAVTRLIARDVCAWPALTRLRDGTLLIANFNRPSHGRMVGDVDTWASKDGGQTWEKRAPGAPHEPGTQSNRMNVAFGALPNGEVLLLASGWSLKPDEKSPSRLEIDKVLRPWVSRSRDGGKTWTVERETFPELSPGGGTQIPFGPVQAGKNGNLLVPFYDQVKDPKTDKPAWARVYVYRSKDLGRTWGEPVALDPATRLSETALLHVGGERWLAFARSDRLNTYASDDDGRTWTNLGPATERYCYPANAIVLADGRVLLCFGNRTVGDPRIEAKVSADGGRTWSAAVRLVSVTPTPQVPRLEDMGYPSSVQLADGRVVTAFYAKRTTLYDGYQLAAFTWDPVKTLAEVK
jgi:BNR repeat-like domain